MAENKSKSWNYYKYLIYMVLLLWVMLILSLILPVNSLGIVPRTAAGLIGIALSPFLHQGFAHLAANTVSLLILGFLLISLEGKRTMVITLLLILLSGAGTWLIGRSGSIHIGASGVIYGYMGYLISSGIFRRDFKSIIIAVIVFFLYGGALWGVFPANTYISWEGHLCGFISGIIIAKKNT